MKNSNLLIIVVIALAAGYFAYPYFNQNDVSAKGSVTKTSNPKKVQASETLQVEEQELRNVPPDPSASNGEKIKKTDPGVEVILADEKQQNKALAEDSMTEKQSPDSTQKASPSTLPVTGAYTAGTKDFSYYRLEKTNNAIAISPTDPRLVLIRGRYMGASEGADVLLVIGENDSSIDFSHGPADTDQERSFKDSNDLFFANVNYDGNLIQIQNRRLKMILNIKNWPSPTLTVDDKETFILNKILLPKP